MSSNVDRRKFLKYTGAAGAAAGATWAAPSVLGSSAVFATGSQSRCADAQTLNWSTYRPLRANPAQAPTLSGTTTFTMKVDAVGANPDVWVRATVTAFSSNLLANGTVSAPAQFPNAGTNNGGFPNPSTGGINNRYLTSGGESHTFNGYDSYYMIDMRCYRQNGYTMTFDFFADSGLTTPIDVFDLKFKIIDIDRQTSGDTYGDKVYLDPATGFTSTKGLRIAGDGTPTSPWTGNLEGVTNDDGTVEVTYAGPINSFGFTYQATQFTNNFNQYIAIGDLTWC